MPAVVVSVVVVVAVSSVTWSVVVGGSSVLSELCDKTLGTASAINTNTRKLQCMFTVEMLAVALSPEAA